MKLLALILTSKNNPHYEVFNEGVMKTWASKSYKNINILPYFGRSGKTTEIVNNVLYVNAPDNFLTLKTLLAFEYALNNIEFDFLIRPNVSTYVRIKKLYDYLYKKPKNNYYAGPLLNIDGVKYPSGTLMMFSKDIIKKIVDGKSIINENQYADDWCIGKYLQDQKIKMSEDIQHYSLIDHWPEEKLINKMFNTPKEEFEKYMTFRCKTEVPPDPILRSVMKRNDPLKMKYLHKFFKDE